MTVIAFHFGAPDKLAYVCRLLRKAVASGSGVIVLADLETQQRLDVELWAISATDFLVHCLQSADGFVRAKSPVILTTDLNTTTGSEGRAYPVLLNLAESVPHEFQVFPRVIEVVGSDEVDRSLARSRWKHYAKLGYDITRHDLTLKGAS